MIEQGEVRKRLIEYLSEIMGTRYDLPKGSLKKSDNIYIVRGCNLGDNIGLGDYSDEKILMGNPLDIIGVHIQEEDFFSKKTNYEPNYEKSKILLDHRQLKLISEGEEHIFSPVDHPPLTYIMQNKVLIPRTQFIKPEKVPNIGYLSDLKQPKGFETFANSIIGEQESKFLIDYLF